MKLFTSSQLFTLGRHSIKSDTWSLGCILHYMVYMRRPFDSELAAKNGLRSRALPGQYEGSNVQDAIDMLLRVDATERSSTEAILAFAIMHRQKQMVPLTTDSTPMPAALKAQIRLLLEHNKPCTRSSSKTHSSTAALC